jgi:DNA-binding XRE family transcriptional regulator
MVVALQLASKHFSQVHAAVESERQIFAAKIRVGRAVLGWSQSTLARRTGLTQRSVHKLEKGNTEPRRATVYAVERVFRDEGIHFNSSGSDFQLTVSASRLTA